MTILGVVAAIAVPNMMRNIEKQQRISQIKEAYSLLNRTMDISMAENGDPM